MPHFLSAVDVFDEQSFRPRQPYYSKIRPSSDNSLHRAPSQTFRKNFWARLFYAYIRTQSTCPYPIVEAADEIRGCVW